MAYVTIDITSSADDFAASTYDTIQGQWPDWQPNDANLETWLIEAFSRIAQEVSVLGHTVAEAVFRAFGEKIVGITPELAQAATMDSTWTLADDAGYTITQGTLVTVARTGDERVAFEVASDVVVAPGDVATAAGEVVLQAVVPGVGGNGLTADPELATALANLPVTDIAAVGESDGGVDEESEAEYTERLVEELKLMTPTPILPHEFATIAKRHPEVEWALAVDLWNPDDDTLDNERTVGLVLLDGVGEDVDPTVKDEVEATLLEMRETNFLTPIGAPEYFLIDVTTVLTRKPGYESAAVDTAVTLAIQDYLGPIGGRVVQGTTLTRQTKVRRYELIQLVENTAGVDFVETLTLAISPGVLGTADLTLGAVVPLTRPDDVLVTVNAP